MSGLARLSATSHIVNEKFKIKLTESKRWIQIDDRVYHDGLELYQNTHEHLYCFVRQSRTLLMTARDVKFQGELTDFELKLRMLHVASDVKFLRKAKGIKI
jgi:hypothetical protein